MPTLVLLSAHLDLCVLVEKSRVVDPTFKEISTPYPDPVPDPAYASDPNTAWCLILKKVYLAAGPDFAFGSANADTGAETPSSPPGLILNVVSVCISAVNVFTT
jgi:hypothetical protein